MNTETYKGLTIRLEQDQDCTSPLEFDDGVTVTYKKGSRYTLGNAPVDAEEFEHIGAEIDADRLIGLPVYAYIHGRTTLNTTGFSCPWDSGQSGYIYISKATALEWQGGKVLTAKRRAACLESLRSVVSEFSKWLNGDCYGYIIEDPDGEHLDSCWGFIGDEYAMQAARESADYYAKKAEEDTRERHYWESRDLARGRHETA